MKVIVCGGRNFFDSRAVFSALDAVNEKHGVSVVIHGRARGADDLAGRWADEKGIPVAEYAADWEQFGKRAGPVRNREMITKGKGEALVAFPGGAGTRDMIRAAAEAGLPVWTPGWKP